MTAEEYLTLLYLVPVRCAVENATITPGHGRLSAGHVILVCHSGVHRCVAVLSDNAHTQSSRRRKSSCGKCCMSRAPAGELSDQSELSIKQESTCSVRDRKTGVVNQGNQHDMYRQKKKTSFPSSKRGRDVLNSVASRYVHVILEY